MINLKERLRKNRLTVGSWMTLGHPVVPEIMAQAGFEWLVVDMEHSAMTLETAQQMVQVTELCGLVPLVRVGENSPLLIKRVMDAGAHGVIVPMVNTKDDAVKAVSAVRYPPEGRRGVGLGRAQLYGLKFARYSRWVNKNSIVVAQIEHVKAVENLQEILDVDGIDATIIGPYDLSASLGCPGRFGDVRVRKALGRYEAVCARMKKPKGVHVVEPDPRLMKRFINRGYTFLAAGFDALYLARKCLDVTAALNLKIKKA